MGLRRLDRSRTPAPWRAAGSTNDLRTMLRSHGRVKVMEGCRPATTKALARPVHPDAMELLAVLGTGGASL